MEWIKVLKDLPKTPQTVNIYFKNSAGFHVGSCYWNGENFIEICEECGYESNYNYKTPVIAWMPLPEPPKDKITMPCGSNHSCLDCRHSVMVTDPCSYLSRMTDGEVDYFMDKLRGKV